MRCVISIETALLEDEEVLEMSDREFRAMITAACLHGKTHGETPPPAFPEFFRYRYETGRLSWDRGTLWSKFKGVCYLCDQAVPLRDFHIEHVVPICRGGADARPNLNIAHPHCNLIKGRKLVEELSERDYVRMREGSHAWKDHPRYAVDDDQGDIDLEIAQWDALAEAMA